MKYYQKLSVPKVKRQSWLVCTIISLDNNYIWPFFLFPTATNLLLITNSITHCLAILAF